MNRKSGLTVAENMFKRNSELYIHGLDSNDINKKKVKAAKNFIMMHGGGHTIVDKLVKENLRDTPGLVMM